jgi:enoyl-CoA hydratase
MWAGVSDRVEFETAFYERPAAGVALLTMNRPEDANGVVPELAADLLDAMGQLEADRSVRVLVLTGAGRQFSGGADLNAMKEYLEDRLDEDEEAMNLRSVLQVTQRLVTSRLPVIAAVNGGATAGGLDLALACDIRIAATRAKFGETYVKIGMVPGNGGTYFLPRLLGAGMAAELALTGEVIDAQRALDIGLITRLVAPDKLLEQAIALASSIARHPAHAVEATKQALRNSWHMDLQAALNTSFWAATALHYSADFGEGVNAYLQRRPPRFRHVEAEERRDDEP